MLRSAAAVALASGLLASPGAAAPAAPGEVLRFLPADTVAVAAVRWSELRSSALYQSCEDRYGFGRERVDFDEFVKVTGIDPLRDVDSFIIAVRGGEHSGGAVGILSGQLEEKQILSLLGERGVATQELALGSVTGRLIRRPGSEREAGFAFLRPGLLMFGDRDSLSAALEARPSAEATARRQELEQVLASADRSGQVWGAIAVERVLPLDKLEREARNTPVPLAALRGVRWLTFDASFDRDVTMTLTGTTASDEDAGLLAEAIEGMLAFTKLGAKERPELLGALAETVIEREGNSVVLSTLLSRELIEKHLAAHHGRSRAPEAGNATQE